MSRKVKLHFKGIAEKKKRKFNPVQVYNRTYKLTEPDDRNFSRPHAVPSALINDISDKRLLSCSMPSPDARIDQSKPAGQTEKRALRDQSVAQAGLRISNALSLSILTVEKLVNDLRQEVATFKSSAPLDFPLTVDRIQERESQVSQMASSVSTALASISNGLTDLHRCSSDLCNLQTCSYIEAVSERRKAWLSLSAVPARIQTEMCSMPINVHSPGESPPDLLGSQATVRFDQVIKERECATNKSLLDIAKAGARSFTAPKQQGQKPSQKKGSQGRNQSMEYKSPLPDVPSNAQSFQTGTSATNNNSKPGGGPKRRYFKKKSQNKGNASKTQSKSQ
jgi:hypothetical protein